MSLKEVSGDNPPSYILLMTDVIWVVTVTPADSKIYQLIDSQELQLLIAFDSPGGISATIATDQILCAVAAYLNVKSAKEEFSELYLIGVSGLLASLKPLLSAPVLTKITTTLPISPAQLTPKDLILKLSGEIVAQATS